MSTLLSLLLQAAFAAPAAAADAAVIVAIEDYVVVADLPGAQAAGRDWYRFFAEERGIPLAQISLLVDTEATREALEGAARRAQEQVGEGGLVWFVFIGHGAENPQDREPLLIGWDVRSDAQSVMSRSLRREALIAAMEGGTEHETVLILDVTSVSILPPDLLLPNSTIPRYPVTGSAVVVSGSHPLSPVVLDALRGAADADRDGQITVGELRASTRAQVIAPGDSIVLSRPARRRGGR